MDKLPLAAALSISALSSWGYMAAESAESYGFAIANTSPMQVLHCENGQDEFSIDPQSAVPIPEGSPEETFCRLESLDEEASGFVVYDEEEAAEYAQLSPCPYGVCPPVALPYPVPVPQVPCPYGVCPPLPPVVVVPYPFPGPVIVF